MEEYGGDFARIHCTCSRMTEANSLIAYSGVILWSQVWGGGTVLRTVHAHHFIHGVGLCLTVGLE